MTLPVLITRPGDRGRVLAEALRQAGYPVDTLDVMQLQALPEDAAMRQAWLDIDHYHKIVVVSPFAAGCLSEALDRYWPQLPVGIDYYCVGQATAAALHDRLGVRVHLPPATAGEDTSEALLRLASLQTLAHQRVLIVAGEGGRALLADTLAARGAQVTRLAVYRRCLLTPPNTMQAHLATGDYRALVVTSGELLEHLAKWCQPAALNQPLIVSSHRLATLAERLGFHSPIVASGATPPALIAALARA
ncbi:uroporphyrinogen-III synthase [Halomonas gomseomensis]|uniref:Uroporphyrinogen-III synthase n=1 Tax=Vreelandella gomseomensis TaxID=370766 RepID=A0ABU1G9Q8_9GAMM|nr:uroporphyrinogen-III synthase [Halomonas gomseomensis]MDR5874231.1 uroporphyrinogen-III synthase [Halomonas gomseomensis]